MNTINPFASAVELDPSIPEHDRIALRAREIWRDMGCPENRDLAIWLEAEAELHAIEQKTFRHPHLPTSA